jgi:hypothetical protein
MTKFEDQLFDDLMREHGSSLTNTRPPVARRHVATRRALLAVGGGGVAVAAAAGVLVATAGTNAGDHPAQLAIGKTPAYAVTSNPDGTVTLAVYRKAGIAGANATLHELGDSRVYVVPVEAGCPSMSSLPAPAVPLNGKHLSIQSGSSVGGPVTVNAHDIPAGDILVVAVQTITNGTMKLSVGVDRLTSAPAPSCVSLPALLPPLPPAPPAGPTVTHGTGSGPALSANG